MKISRRQALKLGLAGSGTLLSPLGFSGFAQAQCLQEPLPPGTQLSPFSPHVERFAQPLYIPEALKPLSGGSPAGTGARGAIDDYEITMRKQFVELMPAQNGQPAVTTEVWSYNGAFPGPLIRQRKGRVSCIRFINQLGQDADGTDICTSVHLHGMASLPQYDGYAEDLIPLNHYKDYYYPNNRASILWYHDHAIHKTSRNVYMGLAGMYIVEYDREDFCHQADFGCLPSGEFELPLIIQDKTFAIASQDHWRLVFNDRNHLGVYADVTLINGTPFPYLNVKRRKYYFRVLNASASRTYQLALSRNEQTLTIAGDPITVIGSDAGLLAAPAPLVAPNQPLRIGVAERYGIIIDFAKFPADVQHVYLRDLGFADNLGAGATSLMRFDLQPDPVIDDSYIPNQLGIVTRRDALERHSTQTRTFRFGRSGQQWGINNHTWDRGYVAAQPKQCDIEIWQLVNTGGWTHPVHIHLVDFQILDRNGSPPLPYEQGWKDVVVLNDLETVRVIAKFAPHRGKYMMHCHNLAHEDHDMMTQFEVGTDGPDPLSEPAKPLPAQPLSTTRPPTASDGPFPPQCAEVLPTNCPRPPLNA